MNFVRLWGGGFAGAWEVTIQSDFSVELLTGAEFPDIDGLVAPYSPISYTMRIS